MGRYARISHRAWAATDAGRRDHQEGCRRAARSVADRRDGAIGADGAGVAHGWHGTAAVRRSLHRRRARRGQRTGRACVLPQCGRVAQVCRDVGRAASTGPSDYGRGEPDVPLHRRQRAVSVVAAYVHVGGDQKHHLVPRQTCPHGRATSTGTTRSASGRLFRLQSSSRAAS